METDKQDADVEEEIELLGVDSWRDRMAVVRTVLGRLRRYHAPEHFYSPNAFSPLARKYPFIAREAAVLVPLIMDNSNGGQLNVLLTQRSQLVRTHKGEVALPGGMRETADRSPIETALREAHEEVGLPYEYVRVGAALTPMLTRHDFLIFPVLGIVNKSDFRPVHNGEVDVCFQLPLRRFLSDRGHSMARFRAERSNREFVAHFFQDDVDGRSQMTFGITAVICMWAAMLVYQRKPSFPIYMFEDQELSMPFERMVREWDQTLNGYLTRRLQQVQTTSRL